MKDAPKSAGKIGKVIIAAGGRRGGTPHAAFHQPLRLRTANQIDGLDNGFAGKSLEFTGKMVFTDARACGNVVQSHGGGDVFADICHGLFYMFICGGTRAFWLICGVAFTQRSQKTQNRVADIRRGTELLRIVAIKSSAHILKQSVQLRVPYGILKIYI